MKRRAGIAAVVAAALAGGSVCAADCASYAVEGVRLGMGPRDVTRLLGNADQTVRESDDTGVHSAATFARSGTRLEVRFDGEIGKSRPEARVASLRLPLPVTGVPPAGPVADLLARMGPPRDGADRLASGLASGPAFWLDESCGVLATAYRATGAWWSSEAPAGWLEVETLDAVRRRADRPAARWLASLPPPAPPPPTPALVPEPVAERKPEPTPPPVASAPEPRPALEPAAAVVTSVPPEPSSVDVPAQRIPESFVAPRVPPWFRTLIREAHVTLQLSIWADGTVGDARVLQAIPSGQGLEAAAVQAAKRWKYKPATHDGVPTASTVVLEVTFR